MSFEDQLTRLINHYGIDSKVNIADYIVAKHVIRFMDQLRDISIDLTPTCAPPDFDESMDGDHASALASAGYGTDEDYGGTDERF